MKRIILTVSNDISYDQRMHRICESLANNGFSVLLVGRKRKHSIPLQTDSFSKKRLRCLFNSGPLFYAEYNVRLFIFLLFQPFDILCAIDLDTLLPNLFTAKLKRKKCLYDAHEFYTEVPELIGRSFTKKIWEKIAGYGIPKMTASYTVNDSLAAILSNQYHQEFKVVRNVPILVHHEKSKAKKEKFILYQGAINKGRGLEELVLAMKNLSINLVLIGEGDLTKKIKQLIADHNLENQISMKGFVEAKKLREYTSNAYIGYNLLDQHSKSYYYSLSNKFFDYIHAGIPSLSNNFPEYKRVNEKFKVTLLCDLKVEDIVKSINLLLSNQKLYDELESNCLKAQIEFNWQNEEKRLLDVYQNI